MPVAIRTPLLPPPLPYWHLSHGSPGPHESLTTVLKLINRFFLLCVSVIFAHYSLFASILGARNLVLVLAQEPQITQDEADICAKLVELLLMLPT